MVQFVCFCVPIEGLCFIFRKLYILIAVLSWQHDFFAISVMSICFIHCFFLFAGVPIRRLLAIRKRFVAFGCVMFHCNVQIMFRTRRNQLHCVIPHAFNIHAMFVIFGCICEYSVCNVTLHIKPCRMDFV